MNRGGIENFIMNIYRKLNRSMVQFDFLVIREQVDVFEEEIILLGGKIYHIPHIEKVGLTRFRKNVTEFFQEHNNYKILHCHMNTWAGFFFPIAKKCGIPIRISHSHNTADSRSGLKELMHFMFKKYNALFINSNTTHYFACSKKAGEWLFGTKISNGAKLRVINNGIDAKKFRFNKEQANKLRKELNIADNTFVIGHVGRFEPQKNHRHLIDIFNAINERVADSVLCLVGDGKLKPIVEEYAQAKGLSKKVKFLGIRSDVHDLLKVFDVFVMPSLFEGLPVTVVEAQAASLPCVLSDSITREVDMGMGIIEFVGLNQSLEYWAGIILKKKNSDRNMSTDKLIELGYDCQTTANWLENFYTTHSEKMCN